MDAMHGILYTFRSLPHESHCATFQNATKTRLISILVLVAAPGHMNHICMHWQNAQGPQPEMQKVGDTGDISLLFLLLFASLSPTQTM